MRERHGPEYFARLLLSRLRIKPPVHLENIARALGLEIRGVPATGYEGTMFRHVGRGGGIIAVRGGMREPGRERFTIAHEIGHYLLPGQKRMSPVCHLGDVNAWGSEQGKQENAANRFAAELLLPTDAIAPILAERLVSVETVKFISETFNTSLTAAAFKCVDATESECALVLSVDGVVQKCRPSKLWRYILFTKCPLGPSTLAWQLSKDSSALQKRGVVAATAWASGAKFMEMDARVLEDSILLPYYNTVLSILTPIAK